MVRELAGSKPIKSSTASIFVLRHILEAMLLPITPNSTSLERQSEIRQQAGNNIPGGGHKLYSASPPLALVPVKN
jgi:hypothetical protein